MNILDVLPNDIILKILEYMDENDEYTVRDILNFATCNKSFMNNLLDQKIKFYKYHPCNVKYITSPFFSYDVVKTIEDITPRHKKIYLCEFPEYYEQREKFITMDFIKQICFDNKINTFISSSNMPKNITHLTFGNNCTTAFYILPNKLTHLTLGNGYNTYTFATYFPDSLTHLTFGSQFNTKFIGKLPNSITHLTFGISFNQPVDDLPKNLTHLSFGNLFNKSVDNLPKNLTHLSFGNLFNKSVDNLPKNLTHLTFGKFFNKSIDNLPDSITHLTFGKFFNKCIIKNQTINIMLYNITKKKYCKFKSILPKTLQKIKIPISYSDIMNNIDHKINIVILFSNSKNITHL